MVILILKMNVKHYVTEFENMKVTLNSKAHFFSCKTRTLYEFGLCFTPAPAVHPHLSAKNDPRSSHHTQNVNLCLLSVSKSSVFYEDPRYIMFIYMVINDALQLSLVTALYVVSYIFRMIHASICCLLVKITVMSYAGFSAVWGCFHLHLEFIEIFPGWAHVKHKLELIFWKM